MHVGCSIAIRHVQKDEGVPEVTIEVTIVMNAHAIRVRLIIIDHANDVVIIRKITALAARTKVISRYDYKAYILLAIT